MRKPLCIYTFVSSSCNVMIDFFIVEQGHPSCRIVQTGTWGSDEPSVWRNPDIGAVQLVLLPPPVRRDMVTPKSIGLD